MFLWTISDVETPSLETTLAGPAGSPSMAASNLYSDYSVYDVAKLAVLLCRHGQLSPYWAVRIVPKLKQMSLPAMVANSKFWVWTPPPEDAGLLHTRGTVCWRCLSWEATKEAWILNSCPECYEIPTSELEATGLIVPHADVQSLWVELRWEFNLGHRQLRDLFYMATLCELQAHRKRKLTS